MHRSMVFAFFYVCLFSTLVVAQTSAPSAQRSESTGRLPVKKVVLYKNGVGYFEHAARVRGTQELSIDFTTAQLNDVLKSLTVLDLGEGRISSLRYNSVAPLSERLRALRLPVGENATQEDFLNALRGTRLYARTGGDAATGKLLSVETRRKPAPEGKTPAEVTEIVLVTDGGEMRTFELGPETIVRVADRDLNEEVSQYLNVIGSARAQDLRRMTIAADGSGEREIFVSYISEVPVWKSTYRIILPDAPCEKPLLQGWAIVDNTIGEDWKDVQLSLVAGAPQSFVQQISQPYYVRRPFVAMPESMSLTPQTHEAALMQPQSGFGIGGGIGMGIGAGTASLEGIVDDPSGAMVPGARVTIRNDASGFSQTTTTDSAGRYMLTGLPRGESTLTVARPGFNTFQLSGINIRAGLRNQADATLQLGSVASEVMVTAAPSAPPPKPMIIDAIRRGRPEAEAREMGDQFEYEIKGAITIGKNESALVPILQTPVAAEKVTLWNDGSRQPRRALWITNTSGLTLDGGTFNVLDSGAFAGEGLIEILHPGEKRLISYASDLAVSVETEKEPEYRPITKVGINKGAMITTKEELETTTYHIRNSDTSPRQVIIEHPARDKWGLTDDSKPVETSASFHRFRVMVGAQKAADLVIKERHPLMTTYRLMSLDDRAVGLLIEQTRWSPEVGEALRSFIDKKNAIAELNRQIANGKQAVDSISKDQDRVRENMKALKGSSEEKSLLQRYVRQLDAQEDRIAGLRAEIAGLLKKRQAAQADLDKTLENLTLEVAM